ncbi:MAG: hypothetical protein K2W97_07145 [Chthoniobacterales bacterium]|nr:hypothetical protein [Chthoniobacterales bacterium]
MSADGSAAEGSPQGQASRERASCKGSLLLNSRASGAQQLLQERLHLSTFDKGSFIPSLINNWTI